MDSLGMIMPVNVHGHFRDIGPLMDFIVPFTAREFQIGQAMPNTQSPILTGDDAVAYRLAILEVAKKAGYPNFDVMTSIKLTHKTKPATILDARKKDVRSFKIYIKGTTTNSDDGIDVDRFWELGDVFSAAQDCEMICSGHCEIARTGDHVVSRFDRERRAQTLVIQLAREFPDLRIVVEHVSTADMVRTVERLPKNVGASITPHHLTCTVHDLMDHRLHPDYFCQPVLQEFSDQRELIRVATSGHPKFFYGGDDALHLASKKYCPDCCSGIFNAPVAVPLMIQLFEKHNALAKLDDFMRQNALRFYGLGAGSDAKICYRKESWKVPERLDVPGTGDYVVPFLAGRTLQWQAGC